MKLNKNGGRLGRAAQVFVIGAAVLAPSIAPADTLEALHVASGYQIRSIELGVPFGGAITQHARKPNILFVSAGNYGEHTILEVDVDAGTTRTITGVIGNIGGLAMLKNSDIAITENMKLGTILRARGLAGGNIFLEVDEMAELIQPIQVDSAFTGAQMIVAPEGNAAGIPAGALLVQTADGPGAAEILVVQNPDSFPTYFPANAPWFHGFTYNGGLAFSPSGDVVCGVSDFPVGYVVGLVNADGNNVISANEAHELVSRDVLTNSLSDLAVSGDGMMVTVENSGDIRWFQLPENLATGTVETSGVLALTNATYLSTVLIDGDGDFTPGGSGPAPTAYLGGFVTYPAATNLLAISPIRTPASARGWEWLE